MNVLKIIFPLVMLCVSMTSRAQVDDLLRDTTISEMLKKRGAECVAQMNDYISYMADKSKDLDTRLYFRKKALNLFVGKGEPYEENGQMRSGVYMEISSVHTKNKSRRLMKDYFSALAHLRYDTVKITSTKVNEIPVSKLQQIDDNKYVCTAYFEQIFLLIY